MPPAEVQELQEQLEELAEWKDEAIRDQDFERAAYLRDREKEVQEEIKRRRDEWERKQEEKQRTPEAKRKPRAPFAMNTEGMSP